MAATGFSRRDCSDFPAPLVHLLDHPLTVTGSSSSRRPAPEASAWPPERCPTCAPPPPRTCSSSASARRSILGVTYAVYHFARVPKEGRRRGTTAPTKDSDGRSRGGLTRTIHLAGEGGCRPMAFLVAPGQWGDAPQMVEVLERIRVPRPGAVAPAPGRTTWAATRHMAHVGTGAVCEDARSSTPSPSRRTNGPTANAEVVSAAGPPASTARTTNAATKSIGRSTGSRTPGPSPPVTTRGPTSSTAPSPLRLSGRGSGAEPTCSLSLRGTTGTDPVRHELPDPARPTRARTHQSARRQAAAVPPPTGRSLLVVENGVRVRQQVSRHWKHRLIKTSQLKTPNHTVLRTGLDRVASFTSCDSVC